MVHLPALTINPCPNCGRAPKFVSHLFRLHARFECECGVSGPWTEYRHYDCWPERRAAEGWSKVAGEPKAIPPHRGVAAPPPPFA